MVIVSETTIGFRVAKAMDDLADVCKELDEYNPDDPQASDPELAEDIGSDIGDCIGKLKPAAEFLMVKGW